MFRSVSLVAYGIPTEFQKYQLQFTTTENCIQAELEIRKKTFLLSLAFLCVLFLLLLLLLLPFGCRQCASDCAKLLHTVELILYDAKKKKCGCKQKNIYVKTTKYSGNNLNILFIRTFFSRVHAEFKHTVNQMDVDTLQLVRIAFISTLTMSERAK